MILGQPLFRKHFFITVGVFASLLLIGFTASFLIMRADRDRSFNSHDIFYAKAVEVQSGDRTEFVKRLNKIDEPGFPFVFDLVDEKGKSLLTALPHWNAEEFRNVQLPSGSERVFTLVHSEGPATRIVRLKSETGPNQFLVVDFIASRMKRHDLKNVLFLFMLGSILIASALSIWILFNSFRVRAQLAEGVLSELQRGNLKARFPITRLDEVGHLMQSFNKMADEIERLVSRLQDNDKARVRLLQELAHDLRTPVASLKSLLETLHEQSPGLTPEIENEIRGLAVKEVEFFERLVEDLLFLGQVMEPKYRKRSVDVDLAELFEEQVRIVSRTEPAITARIHREALGEIKPYILGDDQLLTRLVRNGLENSFSFAKSRVDVELAVGDGRSLIMRIIDDGPGLTPHALQSFGVKRGTRLIGSQNDGRLSVGLGSVIMVTIAGFHLGSVSIANRLDLQGKVIGACLEIILPLSRSEIPTV